MDYRPIVFSLVLYQHSLDHITSLLESVCRFQNVYPNFEVTLAIYDGSPKSFLNAPTKVRITEVLNSIKVIYTKDKNIGYGCSNNINFRKSIDSCSDFLFIIVNPDIYFSPQSLLRLINFLNGDSALSCVAPLVLNPPNTVQYSVKKDPTFLSLLLGFFSFLRFVPCLSSYDFNHRNLFRDYYSEFIYSSYLSGCFLVVPSCFYSLVDGFDEDFFLHLEDADFVRRLSVVGTAVHFPHSYVFHHWARGSHKSFRQILFLLSSYLRYVRKWGFRLF